MEFWRVIEVGGVGMVSHVQTWDGEYTGYKMLNMEHPGTRTRGRPQGSFMNVMKEEIYMGWYDRMLWDIKGVTLKIIINKVDGIAL